ncbi:hypothetical protein HW555_002099 [Spodoptera exigua]|uniref:MADF domain-containing protein n=1 Tax=Spodoptera exigua TaxID=7107 RepID=A0A835GRD5_SPOEX|nr:hypothetical protein HW555_002099 [Spodoptera exigua]
MAATAWTNEKTLEFIEQYKNKPLLWDIVHNDYRNKIKRHDALLELANSFEISKEEVEKKIKNLQTTFSKENKKDEIYVSKCYAFQAMMFLQERNRPRSTVSTEDRPHSSMSTDRNSQGSESGMDSSVDSEGSRKRRLKRNDNAIDKTLEMVNSLIHNRKEVDEYTLFGEQIAFKLRALKKLKLVNMTIEKLKIKATTLRCILQMHNLQINQTSHPLLNTQEIQLNIACRWITPTFHPLLNTQEIQLNIACRWIILTFHPLLNTQKIQV